MNDQSYTSAGESDPGARVVDLGLPASALAFTLKRRVNPAAAFDELVRHLERAVEEDPAMAKAFAPLRTFNADFVVQADSGRLAELDFDAREDLDISVAGLPKEVSLGLALLYDGALKTLEVTDVPLEPAKVDARVVSKLVGSFNSFAATVGAASVQAVEISRRDSGLLDRLAGHAKVLTDEVGRFPQQGPCEFCTLTTRDRDGNILGTYCGTEDQCGVFGVLWLILLLILLLDWIFGWF